MNNGFWEWLALLLVGYITATVILLTLFFLWVMAVFVIRLFS